MSDSTTPLQQITAGANADVRVNENFDAASPSTIYGRRAATSTGLVWGYCGGRWGGFSVANGTHTLTTAVTNYVVVLRSTGASSASTATTNWADSVNYARCYLVVAGASTITSYEDHRAGPGGVHGPLASTITGAVLSAVNVFTRNQSTTPSPLTSAATVVVDASLSNTFKLTLAINATLANPTNLTDGMLLYTRIKQDATGSRTLGYGSMYKFSGGTPVLSTAANAVDLLTCYYDSTDNVMACRLEKGFA